MTTFTVANLTDIAQAHFAAGTPGSNGYTTQGAGVYTIDATGSPTVMLDPTLMTPGQRLTLKKTDASGSPLNVNARSGLIDGFHSHAILPARGFATYEWDGANWWIIG
jgi:hypothetical protein